MSAAGARGPGAVGPRISPSSQDRTYRAPAAGSNRTRASARAPEPRGTDVVVRRESAVISKPFCTKPAGTPSPAAGATPDPRFLRIGADAAVSGGLLPSGGATASTSSPWRHKEFRPERSPRLDQCGMSRATPKRPQRGGDRDAAGRLHRGADVDVHDGCHLSLGEGG